MTALSDNLPARKAEQVTGNQALADILAKIIAAPATEAKLEAVRALLDGTLTVSGPLTDAQLGARGLATEATLDAIGDLLAAGIGVTGPLTNAQLVTAALMTNAKGEELRALLAGTLTARPSTDQDPIFDEANGVRVATGATASVFTPAAGCKFARFDATVDTFIRTDNVAAADAAGAIRLVADQPEIIPVTAGVAVRAYSATAGVLRITPLKVRP